MIVQKYLIISKTGNIVVRQQPPRLSANEIAVRFSLDVPNELFQRPVLEASMKIPKEAIPATKITPKITDNLEQIIKEATGLNMVVSIIPIEEDKKKIN